jgi:hypothetical protein
VCVCVFGGNFKKWLPNKKNKIVDKNQNKESYFSYADTKRSIRSNAALGCSAGTI